MHITIVLSVKNTKNAFWYIATPLVDNCIECFQYSIKMFGDGNLLTAEVTFDGSYKSNKQYPEIMQSFQA